MIVRKTTAEESRRVNEIFAIAFEQPLQNGPADPENQRIYHWAAYDDITEAMMSTISISDFQIQFDGHSCKMGGIGGVATLPQYRRTGGIRGCFEAALPDMYTAGYDFSYLYPFSTGYYRKFGYECCVQKYHTAIHLGLLNPPPTSGILRLAESSDPMTEAIRAIDSIWEKTYNMMVLHQDADYAWTKKAYPAATQEFTYVYFGSGMPKAYTTFKKEDQPDGRNLICSRFCFTDKEGFWGLMQLFKSLSADHMYVKFHLPAGAGMQYLMSEWSLGAAQWEIQPAGMVRVINVKRVLEKARYIGSGSLTLKIHDPQIKENNCSFAVAFRAGRAISVEMTQAEPDAVLSIQAFSALLAGVCDFADAAQWFSGLEVLNPSVCLAQIFYRKPLMISDFF